jgi:hypothetical protein
VPKDSTYTLDGSLNNTGTLKVDGDFDVSGDVTMADGASYGGSGTISVEAGGTLTDNKKRASGASYAFGALDGGTVEIKDGGEFKVNASANPGGEVRTLVGGAGDDDAFFRVGTGSGIKLVVDGTAETFIVTGEDVELGSIFPPSGKSTVNLYANQTLVIEQGAKLTLTGNLNIAENRTGGAYKVNGELVIESGGQLEAYTVFTDNLSGGTITVEPEGKIVQVGARYSANHLIVHSNWTGAIGAPEGPAGKTWLKWKGDDSDVALVFTFSPQKTITGTAKGTISQTNPDEKLYLTGIFGSGVWTSTVNNP